ncbi:VWA domain-containing protein [Neomegalonema sp.]|uniref:VWA domain-containing protein n=1 Tax=Neomegalonema sp. TaxID=2039713 RepID=UPI0026160736|nr:VWA domain-containing protein [Neomegalonema sp.]MDD2867355.1 VWA domain-containing protein [Neomegalonema sp.]
MNLSFAWPWVFLLAPLPLLLLRGGSGAEARGEPGIEPPPRLRAALDEIAPSAPSGGRLALLLLWGAWLALLGALAQPSRIAGAEIQPATGRAMILAMDLSFSMERKDFQLDGRAVDRLTAVKSVATEFVRAREGDRVGLILFGDQAFSAAPVTYDLSAAAQAVREAQIGMAGRTTAMGDAIGLAILKLRDDPARRKTLVLLSDGANNAGEAEPEAAAALARSFGLHIHTIGLGSERDPNSRDPIDPSADLDEETLKRVAQASGGEFFRARTTAELGAVYDEIGRIEATQAEAPPFTLRQDLRNWPLSLAAGLLLLLGLLHLRARRPA